MSTIHRMASGQSSGDYTGILPQAKDPPSTLFVMWAFDKNDEGDMVPAFDPREMPDERRAIVAAKLAASTHAAAIAWKRSVRPDKGEFGEPEVLYRHGPVPDLD